MLNNLLENQTESVLEKDEELFEMTLMALNLSGVCGLIKAGMKVSKDTDLNEYQQLDKEF